MRFARYNERMCPNRLKFQFLANTNIRSLDMLITEHYSAPKKHKLIAILSPLLVIAAKCDWVPFTALKGPKNVEKLKKIASHFEINLQNHYVVATLYTITTNRLRVSQFFV